MDLSRKLNKHRIQIWNWPLSDGRNGNMSKVNKHSGTNFDNYLIEEGVFDEVQARALKRALAEQLSDAMQSGNLSKVLMAQRMVTSRSQLDRVLDPDNLSIQLDTLIKAARAVGKTVEIRLIS